MIVFLLKNLDSNMFTKKTVTVKMILFLRQLEYQNEVEVEIPMMCNRFVMHCGLAAMKGPTSSLIDRLAKTRMTLIKTSSTLLMELVFSVDSSKGGSAGTS